ncbi:hypothetical protein [Actinomadura sp. B10D3]|uniref:hypothetical protein n=1 Tax=Actinomadura sp. B10D3 TaxID=3153557 RepID=UPI00325CAC46
MYSHDREWSSDHARRYSAAGYAKGLAVALMYVLRACGIKLGEDELERVNNCTDADQLERWLRRAVVVRDAGALFA